MFEKERGRKETKFNSNLLFPLKRNFCHISDFYRFIFQSKLPEFINLVINQRVIYASNSFYIPKESKTFFYLPNDEFKIKKEIKFTTK